MASNVKLGRLEFRASWQGFLAFCFGIISNGGPLTSSTHSVRLPYQVPRDPANIGLLDIVARGMATHPEVLRARADLRLKQREARGVRISETDSFACNWDLRFAMQGRSSYHALAPQTRKYCSSEQEAARV